VEAETPATADIVIIRCFGAYRIGVFAEKSEQIIELAVVGLSLQRRVCAALPATAGGESGDDLHIQGIWYKAALLFTWYLT
jgi:hypothetical protein